MLVRLECAFAAQERFIGDVAHELTTPLTTLKGEAQLLTKPTDEDFRRFADLVLDQVQRLIGIVHSFLMLARTDAGFPPGPLEPIDVEDVADAAVSTCIPLAQQRRIRLAVHFEDPTDNADPSPIRGDADLLRVMLENLIRNAISHSPPDSVVEVRASRQPHCAQFIVSDHGPGIPQHHLDRIFERFYSASSNENASRGHGLGLAIAKGIAEMHGGVINVRNRDFAGCEFSVILPATLPRQTT